MGMAGQSGGEYAMAAAAAAAAGGQPFGQYGGGAPLSVPAQQQQPAAFPSQQQQQQALAGAYQQQAGQQYAYAHLHQAAAPQAGALNPKVQTLNPVITLNVACTGINPLLIPRNLYIWIPCLRSLAALECEPGCRLPQPPRPM